MECLMESPFAILGIRNCATNAEIMRAFRSVYPMHTDRHHTGTPEDKRKQMQKLEMASMAKNVLKNQTTRPLFINAWNNARKKACGDRCMILPDGRVERISCIVGHYNKSPYDFLCVGPHATDAQIARAASKLNEKYERKLKAATNSNRKEKLANEVKPVYAAKLQLQDEETKLFFFSE